MSKFDTHGGYFAPKDYLKVNEGGSHEENPNGGVQIGVDPEGTPNLLEEGEPVYKDYVYSDNIEAEKEFLEQNNLPGKYAGKLYSKIADDLFSEAEERPLDPISRNGLEALLGRLADAQEGQKRAKEQRDLENELANLSPEELDQLEAMLAQTSGTDQDGGAAGLPVSEVVPEEQIMGPAEPMPVEGVPMMANGGNLFRAGGPDKQYWRPGGMWTGLRAFPDYVSTDIYGFQSPDTEVLDPAIVVDRARRVRQPNYPGVSFGSLIKQEHPISWDNYTWLSDDDTDDSDIQTLAPAYVQDYGRKIRTPEYPRNSNGNIIIKKPSIDWSNYTWLSNPTAQTVTVPDVEPSDFDYEGLPIESASDVDLGELGKVNVPSVTSQNNTSSNLLPTWPRYAGAIGSGLLGLYNAFQSPDRYTAQHINPQLPEGRINLQNQVYNPVDQNMVANAQIAQGNATNRALRNSGLGPSSAAAILAADNNTTGNLGTGFLQTWDANNQRRNAVIAANNQAEAQRAQFDYTVDAARKEAINRLAPYNAQNNLMVQRLNNQAEADKYTAISNQISNGLQALSGIGQENFAMNQINTNPAFLGYKTGESGAMFYNPLSRRLEIIPTSYSAAKTNPKPKQTVTTGLLFEINTGLPYNTDPFMGYNLGYNKWTSDTKKNKK